MVGNYMNDSRKQASGFKLQSLARMAGVKDEHNVSFLHHVEKVVRTAFPALETFMEDLKPCKDAALSIPPTSSLLTSFHPGLGTQLRRIHRLNQNRTTLLRHRRPLRPRPFPPRRHLPKPHSFLPARSAEKIQIPLLFVRSDHENRIRRRDALLWRGPHR
jgi:Formin Homology 2 Domain